MKKTKKNWTDFTETYQWSGINGMSLWHTESSPALFLHACRCLWMFWTATVTGFWWSSMLLLLVLLLLFYFCLTDQFFYSYSSKTDLPIKELLVIIGAGLLQCRCPSCHPTSSDKTLKVDEGCLRSGWSIADIVRFTNSFTYLLTYFSCCCWHYNTIHLTVNK